MQKHIVTFEPHGVICVCACMFMCFVHFPALARIFSLPLCPDWFWTLSIGYQSTKGSSSEYDVDHSHPSWSYISTLRCVFVVWCISLRTTLWLCVCMCIHTCMHTKSILIGRMVCLRESECIFLNFYSVVRFYFTQTWASTIIN